MKNSEAQRAPARSEMTRASVGLGLAFISACSGEFPVGDFGERGALLDGSDGTARGTSRSNRRDGTLAAALPEPDASAALDATVLFGSITPIGDLDGDGNADVAITASDLEQGYVFIRYGGPRLTTAESASEFLNDGPRVVLPRSLHVQGVVAAAGDVDGDGFDDVLVLDTVCVYSARLLYGGAERLDGTLALADIPAHFTRSAFSPHCQGDPGFSPGDLDGDGRDDLVLAAPPRWDADDGAVLGEDEGLYVFYGREERFSGDIPFAAADARLNAATVLDRVMSGDMNGDGLSDSLVGSLFASGHLPDRVYYVPGRTDRWSGLVDLGTQAIALDGARLPRSPNMPKYGDVDGDGLSDALLWDENELRASPNTAAVHLFYGTPGLFASGVDFSRSSARLLATNSSSLSTAGDRDGDGDDEIVDQFGQPDTSFANVALVSGSRRRLSGTVTVPEAEVAAQSEGSPQLDIFQWPVAADLDGDGASDVITVTTLSDDETGEPVTRLNFHYGTLAPGAVAPELR